jgi:hypothetical protein
MTEDILIQVQQAILQERTKREYNVIVDHVRKSYGIAGIPIPKGLQAYAATTTCTEQHENGNQCIWADFAFVLKDRIHVILQNDLLCPGLTLEDSAKILIESLEETDA